MHVPTLVFAILVSTAAAPEDELRVLPADPPPGQSLERALLGQAKTLFESRRKTVAALKTPDDLSRRQAALKARFLEALGELPERTPLNPRVTGRSKRAGYTVETVLYESRPHHHVTANLYLPDGKPPFPGVLVPCGHSANGKAAEPYQRACILMARNGLAVLCYDPIGQGERIQLLDAQGKPAIAGSTAEHTMAGIGAWLVGRSLAGYRVWDGIRGLDYLASRPEIDPARLGCTGNSGGGTLTAYLMALDDRIAVAAPSCYITSLERLFVTIGPQDAEQNITGQVGFGMEHADYVTMRAPRPTLICTGTRDFFDIQGSWDSFREAKLFYGRLGFGERVDLFESDEPHGFTRPRREAVVRWMRRWLLKLDDAPVETEFPVASDAELQVTRSGQVLQEFADERSVFAINAERAEELRARRAARAEGRSAEALRTEVRRRLALPEPGSVVVDRRDPVFREEVRIDRWAFTTEPGVKVPVLLFRPEKPAAGPLVVYVGADRALAAPGGPIEGRARAGEAVALVEPRGMGEAAPKRRAGPFGGDEKEAFLSLLLGRPLLGQRVFDLLQSLSGLDGVHGFHLVGVGLGGPIALHAAALDDRVKSVEIERALVSWSAVADTAISRDQLSSVVPGVLDEYDLPELAALIAPRPLAISGAVDAKGVPLTAERIDEAYASARNAYRARGAENALSVRTGPPASKGPSTEPTPASRRSALP